MGCIFSLLARPERTRGPYDILSSDDQVFIPMDQSGRNVKLPNGKLSAGAIFLSTVYLMNFLNDLLAHIKCITFFVKSY
jgi:hypothetical protein